MSPAAVPGTAPATRPRGRPTPPFGQRPDLALLDAALVALEAGHAADRDLDGRIYAAMGWDVLVAPLSRRRLSWRCRGPLSLGWDILPSPTGDVAAAARLVPWGWDWGTGVRGGQPTGWCAERAVRPGRDLPAFFECNRLTPARALCAAALFAHRSILIEEVYGRA